MQIHHLKARESARKSRRVGRGGKRGTYSGRGIKGQRSRAGAKIRPAQRDVLKRIPKLRGHKFKSFRAKPAVVNLGDIEKKFKEGSRVSPESLREAGLVERRRGRIPAIKILSRGRSGKKFLFDSSLLFSRKARESAKADDFL
jgi:large subunit ribosomal protein L15